MESLLSYFENKIQLSPNDIQLVHSSFSVVTLTAKSKIIVEGQPIHHLYFIESGVVKGYKIKNGKSVIEHLIKENTFFTSLDGFINGSVSEDTFESISKSKLYKISKTNLDTLRTSSSKWNDLFDLEMSNTIQCKIERIQDFQTLSAKERYLKFIDQFPDLIQRVSVEDLASFLGIEPQSLSRIRKQVSLI